MNYVANAFSLAMVSGNCDIEVREVGGIPGDAESVESYVGHEDTARVLGVAYNRGNLSLEDGDVLYVAQLTGGRLPEGATTLPEGFRFRYYRVTVARPARPACPVCGGRGAATGDTYEDACSPGPCHGQGGRV